MKNLKKLLESNNDIYGYYDIKHGFIPYYDPKCPKINALYCKHTQKVYAI